METQSGRGGRGRGGDRGGRGGGSGRGRGGGGSARREGGKGDGGGLVQISKKMSYLLRHGAVKEGLPIDKEGYVSFDDLIKHTGISEANIVECVGTNDKQRFQVKEIDGNKFIKANQGHSIAVEDLELKKVDSATEIPTVVHGTYKKAWPIIQNEGLSKMGRNHIHFAIGKFGDANVISGMRSTAEVLVYIDAEKAMKDGIEFFVSDNGVVLTAGDAKGYVQPKYFSKVVDSKGNHLLNSTSSGPSTTTTTTTTSPAPMFNDKEFPSLKK